MSVPSTHHSISLPAPKWEQDLFIDADLNFWTQIRFCVDRFDTILWPLFCCYICWTREVKKTKPNWQGSQWTVVDSFMWTNMYKRTSTHSERKKDVRDFTQKVGKCIFLSTFGQEAPNSHSVTQEGLICYKITFRSPQPCVMKTNVLYSLHFLCTMLPTKGCGRAENGKSSKDRCLDTEKEERNSSTFMFPYH